METLFTVHAGEYLVGSYIEQHFKRLNVWLPSRDTGVDLLVSDYRNRRTVSLQVKFGKDWLVTHVKREVQQELRACGWWSINRDKLRSSPAEFWVFVLLGFAARTTDFIIVPTKELHRRLLSLHGSKRKIQSYLWVTAHGQCWETRGLTLEDQRRIAWGDYRNVTRHFTEWLNNWGPVKRLNT